MRSFALSSGSSANCFYVESKTNDKFLVDLGLSYLKTCEILESRNIDINNLKAVFITHEHSDHVIGIKTFLKNLNCNFYMTKGTFEALNLKNDKIKIIKENQIINFDKFKVFVVSKPHDAKEPVSFVFEEQGYKLGIFTDLGHVTSQIIDILKNLDVIYLEANYCNEIISYKDLNINYLNRLVSDTGHLAVKQSCEILKKIIRNEQKIILSHISENTNNYQNAYLKIKQFLNELGKFPEILVSFQAEPSEWVE